MARMKTVLVVDDDEYTRDILEEGLRWAGLMVRSFPDGQRALDAVRQAPVDAVIMDIMMPGLDGFAVTKILREQWGREEVPIIFLSARTGTEDKIRGLHLGGDYVTKPFDPDEVVARVQAHIRQKELIDRLAEKNQELAAIQHIIVHHLEQPLEQAVTELDGLDPQKLDAARFDSARRRLREQLQHLGDVVKGFAALAAAEVDPARFQPVALGPIVDQAALAVQARERGAELHVARNLPRVMGQPELLREVFRQLLDNALAYGRPGVRPMVRISWRELDESYIVEVADNGRGIARRHLGRIFAAGLAAPPTAAGFATPPTAAGFAAPPTAAAPAEPAPFAQTPAGQGSQPTLDLAGPRPSIPTTLPTLSEDELDETEAALLAEQTGPSPAHPGFGLAIVHRIVESHGGRVWAESQPGKGTQFFLMFPRPGAAQKAKAPVP